MAGCAGRAERTLPMWAEETAAVLVFTPDGVGVLLEEIRVCGVRGRLVEGCEVANEDALELRECVVFVDAAGFGEDAIGV
jgi:hypothetical protein